MDNYIKNKYGYFTDSQIREYIDDIRHMIFWCIIYTDPSTSGKYPNVDIVEYHKSVMQKISGFNAIMLYPSSIVSVMSILEAGLQLLQTDNWTFEDYRKLILDAGAYAKRIKLPKENPAKVGGK